jgi:hypothetical protein
MIGSTLAARWSAPHQHRAVLARAGLSQEGLFAGQIEGKRPKINGKITPGAGRASYFIGTVEPTHRPPKRVRNAEVRAREYLTNSIGVY